VIRDLVINLPALNPKLKILVHSALAAAIGGAFSGGASALGKGNLHDAVTPALAGALVAVAGLLAKSPIDW
jgi:hypothetical protein